jgi:hypothetical protein
MKIPSGEKPAESKEAKVKNRGVMQNLLKTFGTNYPGWVNKTIMFPVPKFFKRLAWPMVYRKAVSENIREGMCRVLLSVCVVHNVGCFYTIATTCSMLHSPSSPYAARRRGSGQ